MTRIVVAGATGLIGRAVVDIVQCAQLHVVTRRAVEGLATHVRQHVVDPLAWPETIAAIKPDVAINCLGTTWKKSGKSEAAFRAVDLDLVLAIASAAKEGGAGHFISVSSVGASSQSSNFYLKTKGEAEDRLSQTGFARLDILRPGLLVGARGGDRRAGERMAIALSPLTDLLMIGSLNRYRSIRGHTVARAIACLARVRGEGRFIHENRAIEALAR